MRKNNITPNPKSEIERNLLQKQLSMGSRMQPGQIPVYYKQLKEKFLQ